MEPLKIGIVGVGNVGRVLGVILSANGYYVEAVTGRSPHNIRVENYAGYELAGDFGNRSYLVRVLDDVSELSDGLDVIFICTKIKDGEEILPKVKNKISPNGSIVTIQNTFWIDKVSKYVNSENSVCMFIDFACETKNGKTYVLNYDGIKLGVYNKSAYDKMNTVHDLLVNICKVKDTNDIVGFVLGRNILNSTISCLGAISGMNLKGILDDRNGRYLFVKMIEEEIQVFSSLGIKVVPYDDKLDYYSFVEKTIKGKINRAKTLRLLKKNNGHVQSSTLREIENGKKVEIIGVLDSFIRHAKFKNVACPYVMTITDMIKDIVSGDRRINENAFYDKNLVEIGRK